MDKSITELSNEEGLPQSVDYGPEFTPVSPFWWSGNVEDEPCNRCGKEFVGYSISNDIWNWAVRNDASEGPDEFICIDCFFSALRETLRRLSDSEWWAEALRHVTGLAEDSVEHYWPGHCEKCIEIESALPPAPHKEQE